MTRISPIASSPAPSVGPTATDAVAPASAAPSAGPAAAVAAPRLAVTSDVMVAAFERLRGSGSVPTETLVAEAVRQSLAARFLGADEATLGRLATQVAHALVDDPGTRHRLERLTGSLA